MMRREFKTAQALTSQVGAGMVEGRITIRVIMMRDGTPSSPNQVSGILFLLATKPVLDAAVTYAKQSHIPTLSLDPSCLRMDFCAVAVRSLPTVQIVIHRSMVKSLDVTFQQAFMMLVKEY